MALKKRIVNGVRRRGVILRVGSSGKHVLTKNPPSRFDPLNKLPEKLSKIKHSKKAMRNFTKIVGSFVADNFVRRVGPGVAGGFVEKLGVSVIVEVLKKEHNPDAAFASLKAILRNKQK